MSGVFITFEGGEGSGKSTQLALLLEAYKTAGIGCIKTREPGGTPGAEKIRELLVNGKADAWDAVTETLLFYAARLDHVNKLIKPALEKGQAVICDRFADSTIVYQGIGKDLLEEYVRSIHQNVLGNFAPDLTLILDIDPAIGLKRAQERRGGEGRFESMDIDFHHKIRAGFLALAKREPERCVVLDANQDKNMLHQMIIRVLSERLGIKISG